MSTPWSPTASAGWGMAFASLVLVACGPNAAPSQSPSPSQTQTPTPTPTCLALKVSSPGTTVVAALRNAFDESLTAMMETGIVERITIEADLSTIAVYDPDAIGQVQGAALSVPDDFVTAQKAEHFGISSYATQLVHADVMSAGFEDGVLSVNLSSDPRIENIYHFTIKDCRLSTIYQEQRGDSLEILYEYAYALTADDRAILARAGQ